MEPPQGLWEVLQRHTPNEAIGDPCFAEIANDSEERVERIGVIGQTATCVVLEAFAIVFFAYIQPLCDRILL